MLKARRRGRFFRPAMRRVNEVVVRWMREAGMDTREDAAGNVRGVTGAGAVRLVMGSHLDTVVNAGAFDGVLGVVLAIEALAAAGKLGFGVEVIGFSEEEGVRFGVPFLGSRAAVGTLDEATLAVRDARGVSVAEAIAGCGLEVGRIREARFGAEARVYLEVHIEQGPVLEAEGRALGVVSAIAGQTRLWVRFVWARESCGDDADALAEGCSCGCGGVDWGGGGLCSGSAWAGGDGWGDQGGAGAGECCAGCGDGVARCAACER